jgi:hypothetical protein
MKNDDKEIHNRKRNNLMWMGFFILLIILHLPFVWIWASILPASSINITLYFSYILMLSPLFSPLMILDFIVFKLFNKESPPWKLCFILLVVFNVLFFSEAIYSISMSVYMRKMIPIVIVPLTLFLLIIDLTAILFFCIKTRPQGITKVISYTVLTALAVISLVLCAFGFAFYKWFILG